MSVPQSNSTHTTEKPEVELERTRRTSVAPVTVRSTSSAAMPLASVITTTVGAFRSGKTSTSILRAVYVPATSSTTPAIITNIRLRNENSMIRFSMSGRF